jgi:hypothetical protein
MHTQEHEFILSNHEVGQETSGDLTQPADGIFVICKAYYS